MTDGIPVEAFLESYPGPIRIAAERLRRLVRTAEPKAIERVRTGWALIEYDLPVGRRTRYFAWIAPEPKHVHLGFQHGVLMADPGRRLRGAHLSLRKVRYFTFTSPGEIDDDEVIRFVHEAVRVASLSKAERLGLALDGWEPADATVPRTSIGRSGRE